MDSNQNQSLTSVENGDGRFDPSADPSVAPIERSISPVDPGARGFTPAMIAAGAVIVVSSLVVVSLAMRSSKESMPADAALLVSPVKEAALDAALAPPTADELTPEQVAALQKAIQQQNEAAETEPPKDLQ